MKYEFRISLEINFCLASVEYLAVYKLEKRNAAHYQIHWLKRPYFIVNELDRFEFEGPKLETGPDHPRLKAKELEKLYEGLQ